MATDQAITNSRCPFPWFIARRYLTARRRQAFISLISAVSIAGVGVGVMALVIALGLMTGVQTEMRDRIVGATAHVYISQVAGHLDISPGKWARPQVIGASPAIIGFGVLTVPPSVSQGVTLKGIDPDTRAERHRHRLGHGQRIARRSQPAHAGAEGRRRAR